MIFLEAGPQVAWPDQRKGGRPCHAARDRFGSVSGIL